MYRRHCSQAEELYGLLRDLFCASAITCFLWAIHRIATAMKSDSRLHALEQAGDAFTAEERESLIEKIKAGTHRI